MINLCLRSDFLIDVARFVEKVEHDLVLHRFIEFVRVNVLSEYLDALALVCL